MLDYDRAAMDRWITGNDGEDAYSNDHEPHNHELFLKCPNYDDADYYHNYS
jgi:hypothetical protein